MHLLTRCSSFAPRYSASDARRYVLMSGPKELHHSYRLTPGSPACRRINQHPLDDELIAVFLHEMLVDESESILCRVRAKLESDCFRLLCLHQVLVSAFFYLSENMWGVFPSSWYKIPQVHVKSVWCDLIHIPQSEERCCLESRDLVIRLVRTITAAIIVRQRNSIWVPFQK